MKQTPLDEGPATLDIDKMLRPVFLEAHGDGLCGGSTAIDGRGVVWRESGCENGSPPYARAGKLPPDRLDRFRAGLEAIRARPDEGSDPKTPCSGGFQAFSLFDDTRVRNWTFCTSSGERVPEAFDALLALSSP